MDTTGNDAAAAALRMAQSTIVNAKWHLCEERALRRLLAQAGLACAPIFPEHPVIQLVALNGSLLGRARLHHTYPATRWIATLAPTGHEVGTYASLETAARAVAHAAGAPTPTTVTCLEPAGPGPEP